MRSHTDDMATWQEFTEAAPALADAVRARLTAHRHHVLATLRADGSPRVSGTEVETFRGLLVLGSMPGARKVRDLHRDPRYALHSNPGHHTMEGGDAKISGRARELTGEEKVSISGVAALKPRQKLAVTITYPDGKTRSIEVLCRIDTEEELSYYRHGGILPFVLRNLASAA